MDALPGVFEAFSGRLQIIEPSDALFLPRGQSRGAAFTARKRSISLELLPRPERDSKEPEWEAICRDNQAAVRQYRARGVFRYRTAYLRLRILAAISYSIPFRAISLKSDLRRVAYY